MPEPTTAPSARPLNGELFKSALRNWYSELRDHDPHDLRGHLEGISIVVALLASRIPEAPRHAPLRDEAFRLKCDRWLECLRELLTTGRAR